MKIDFDNLYNKWYGESHLNTSNIATHDSSEVQDFAKFCIDEYRQQFNQLVLSDCDITNKAIAYSEQFNESDEPMQNIKGYAVRDYYAGFKAALKELTNSDKPHEK